VYILDTITFGLFVCVNLMKKMWRYSVFSGGKYGFLSSVQVYEKEFFFNGV